MTKKQEQIAQLSPSQRAWIKINSNAQVKERTERGETLSRQDLAGITNVATTDALKRAGIILTPTQHTKAKRVKKAYADWGSETRVGKVKVREVKTELVKKAALTYGITEGLCASLTAENAVAEVKIHNEKVCKNLEFIAIEYITEKVRKLRKFVTKNNLKFIAHILHMDILDWVAMAVENQVAHLFADLCGTPKLYKKLVIQVFSKKVVRLHGIVEFTFSCSRFKGGTNEIVALIEEWNQTYGGGCFKRIEVIPYNNDGVKNVGETAKMVAIFYERTK